MADETGAQNDDKGTENAQGGDTSTKGSEGASGAQGTNEGEQNKAPEGTVSLAEYEAIKERMRGADRAKAEAEQKLKEIERKDQSELEKSQGDLADAQKQIESLQVRVTQMALQNAFLTDNKYSWHDPADALALLEKDGLEIDAETGKVTGLRAAIDKLAQKKKHLLKSETGSGKDGEGSSEASGSATNGRRKGDGDGRDKKDYSKRFPALKR